MSPNSYMGVPRVARLSTFIIGLGPRANACMIQDVLEPFMWVIPNIKTIRWTQILSSPAIPVGLQAAIGRPWPGFLASDVQAFSRV